MPRMKGKNHYLEFVKANDVIKDKVTGSYSTQVRGINASTKRSKSERREKQRMQTRQKHVATIVCQIEEIDSQTSCDTRPVIMAAFGTLNIANPTLIDSGADVNVMP